MVVQNQSQLGEGLTIPTDPHHTPTFIQPSTQPQKIQQPRKPKRKDTHVPQPSDPIENVADEVVHKDDEDRLKLDELMALCTTLQNRVLDLEKTKTTQHNEIASLKRRVKKLEKKDRSRTHRLKRLYKVGLTARVESSDNEESLGEDASKQGRIDAIDADEEITLVSVHDVNVSAGEEVFATTVDDITLAQALEEMKSTKPKKKGIEKGKGILIEPVKPMNKKNQIRFDEETTLNLQAEFDEEERLVREKAEKEEKANISLIETWDDIQAKIDVDHQLAERMQAQEQEELSIEEKATLFQQLLEKRRKHFAAKRAEEKRNKPPTKAQQRKIMCTYLKNMEGYKLKDLKLKEFDSIQEMFDKAFKRVNTFEDFRTELVEGKEKRAGTELIQEITKKQKVEDDKETVELKQLMKIIPDEEEVAIDAIPLAVKSPSIVGWKIYKEGRKSYYQIMRADGKSQMYMIFSQMLKSFDREDLEDLYKLVKAKYESTRPVEDLDLILWGDLKTMFEPHVEDKIYMLVEKKYLLAPLILSMMLEKKLIIDYESEMAYQLLKFIMKQLKKCNLIKVKIDISWGRDTTPPISQHASVLETSPVIDDIRGLVWDALGVNSLNSKSEEPSKSILKGDIGDIEEESEEEEDIKEESVEDSEEDIGERPLRLYHIKCMGEISNKTFSMILELIKDAFPHLSSLPSSNNEVKKLTLDLGLGYQKIHVCPNDCMLYLGKRKYQQSCHICNASRYKSDLRDENGDSSKSHKSNKPAKVLHYFPLIPRLKRLYMSEKIAKDMRWHDMELTKDGKLRHPRMVLLGRHSMLGGKAPGTDIEIYLIPLIKELKLLWKGVDAYNAFSKQQFKLRASLLWTVNDFPAYANLSGWSTKGRVACPICTKSTHSNWLKNGRKFCYMGHLKRYNIQNGKYDKSSKKRIRDDIGCLNDKCGAFGDKDDFIEENINGDQQLWKKRSIFFDLPYWEYNLLRHNLDVMHIEKNIFDNLLGTLMNWDGKSKDNENSRKDLKEMGIRHDLHVINLPNKKPYLPPACYSMSNVEKTSFLQVLKNLKVPDGYASNISRGVSLKDRKILNLKSHDGHILMQDILPIALRASMVSRSQSRVVKAVSDLCSFFKGLCAKVLDVNELETLEHQVVQTLCELEQLFPPSFFTIMVHLSVHLISEAKLGGPVQYRWMYPIERFLMRLKSYVRNKAQPEGSIAEGYIKEECLTFYARYFEGVETFMNRPLRNDDIILTKEIYMLNSGGSKLGKVEIVELDGTLFAQAHRYVLLNHPKIQPLHVTKPRDTYDMGINVNMDEDDDDEELYTECMPYNLPNPDDVNETPSWRFMYFDPLLMAFNSFYYCVSEWPIMSTSYNTKPSLSQHVVHDLPSSSQQPLMYLKQHTNKTIQKNASLNGQSSRFEPSLSQHVVYDLPSSFQQPWMHELEDDESDEKVSEVEIIDQHGNILRTTKMMTKDVYKLNEGDKILVHLNNRDQLIKDAAGLCTRFMTVLLKQPNLCPFEAKDWREVKTHGGGRLMGNYGAMKYRTKYKLYGLVRSRLDEANNIGVDEAHELEYTEDQILHALDLVDAPSKVHDQQWESYKAQLRSSKSIVQANKEISRKISELGCPEEEIDNEKRAAIDKDVWIDLMGPGGEARGYGAGVDIGSQNTLDLWIPKTSYFHDKHNLINVGKNQVAIRFGADDIPFKTTNGMFNDVSDGAAGSQGTFIGRNMPPFD
ncbi:hypothetical protein Tco_1020031 [Tanacetum coccineum]|uniref:DUF4218 domain-containing protein n=1 Tax=Tanacetum coccineum TaxID=301880 RepID=A0ABQ5FYV9_9ASTR